MDYRSLKRRCELEDQIRSQIYGDNRAGTHFDYQKQPDGSVTLTLITTNPIHKELFTLYTTSPHPSDAECLDEVLVYLDEVRQRNTGHFNYKVVWFRSGEHQEKFTSYFTGRNFKEIVDKFYHNKNPDDYVIISWTQQPIA